MIFLFNFDFWVTVRGKSDHALHADASIPKSKVTRIFESLANGKCWEVSFGYRIFWYDAEDWGDFPEKDSY